jgi:hypothetical protein
VLGGGKGGGGGATPYQPGIAAMLVKDTSLLSFNSRVRSAVGGGRRNLPDVNQSKELSRHDMDMQNITLDSAESGSETKAHLSLY